MDRKDEIRDECDDDSDVARVIAPWKDVVQDITSGTGTEACIELQADGGWLLVLAVRRKAKRQVFFIDVVPGTRVDNRWSLVQLSPGVWEVTPSVHVPGQIHAFITLVNVPQPPPWVVIMVDHETLNARRRAQGGAP